MYEVVVLQAGSSQALKRWMDAYGYRFPEGMEKVQGDNDATDRTTLPDVSPGKKVIQNIIPRRSS
jgi:hypothetical protein